jgi:periplasmic protein TonB
MGYQALLFCPDEKTARTVTQVLSELEFTVAACTEPFAAVKKLMSDHFDALVVDCDNEQNATLLFKSARNSASNQTALAVAVVEGQAGVAKAFRFGANLVLTKPINVEQAKGTLRVARGLLRKGDPSKPAATPAAPAPPQAPSAMPAAAAKPAASPVQRPAASAPRPAMPVAAKPGPSSLPPKPVPASTPPVPKVSVPAPAAMSHSASVSGNDENLLELGTEESASTPAAPSAVTQPAARNSPASPSILTASFPAAHAPAESKLAVKATSSSSFGSGAASAPAPALEPSNVAEATSATKEDSILDAPVEAAASEPHISSGPTTTFTFGGAALEQESSGASKKILLIAAVVVLVVVGGYFGWNYYQSRPTQGAGPVVASHPAPPVHPPATSGATQSAAAQTTPVPAAPTTTTNTQPASQSPDVTLSTAPDASDSDESADNAPAATPTSKKAVSPPATKPAPATSTSKPAPTPLVVQGGKVSSLAAKPAPATAADSPAPTVIGIAVPGSSAPPLNLVGGSTAAAKPVLEKLNISQGVSQGLLIRKVNPVYPRNALAMRIEGTVELMATISKSGNISSVKVLSGDSQLTEAAADAVKQWKYKPYLLNGEPVEIQTQVTINFRLPN